VNTFTELSPWASIFQNLLDLGGEMAAVFRVTSAIGTCHS
jgi:hypothetical protein